MRKFVFILVFVLYTFLVSFVTYHLGIRYVLYNANKESVFKSHKGDDVARGGYNFYEQKNIKDVKIMKEIVVNERNDDCDESAVNKMWYYLYTNYSLNKKGFDDALTMERWSTFAYEVDIDDDGEQEIIGWNRSICFFGLIGGYGFVVKNPSGEYKEYATVPLSFRLEKLFILEDKSNGMHDIATSFVGLGLDKVAVYKYELNER